MDELENEQVELKKKMIVFRNSKTGEVMAQRQIPKYFRLDDNFIFDLTGLSRKLIMLFIDVLCRGYHPVKGFEQNFRNIFNDEENQVRMERNSALIRIQNVQAISTIWRCLSRQLGKPYKNYNIDLVSKQLFEEVEKRKKQTVIEDRTNINKKKKKNIENYQAIKRKIDNLNEQIKKEMKNIVIRSKNDSKKSLNNQKHVVKVLEQQILNYQHDIFTRSIVGISCCADNSDNCEIILEQCYPSMILSKKEAIEMLGKQFYDKKLNSYKVEKEKYPQQEWIQYCHKCLIPLNHMGRKISCSDKLATLSVEFKNIMTNPYMYCKRIINQSVDYKNMGEYIHPYLIYYQTKISKIAVCNRYYCNRCESTEIVGNLGSCKYCEGVCQCHRCRGMDELTQMMAVYLDNQGDLNQLISKFKMKFTKKTLSYVDNRKECRSSFESVYNDFDYYYDVYRSQNILLEHNELTKFEKCQYFSNFIQSDDKKYNKIQKYKQKIIILPQSKLDREETIMKEKQKDKRIKSIYDSINGNKRQMMLRKRQLKEDQRQQQKKERQVQKQNNNQRQKGRNKLSEQDKRIKQKQKPIQENKKTKKNDKKEDSDEIERKKIFFDEQSDF